MRLLGIEVPGFGQPTFWTLEVRSQRSKPCAKYAVRALGVVVSHWWMMSCGLCLALPREPGSRNLKMMRKEMAGPSFKPMGIDRWALGEAGTARSFYFLQQKSRPVFFLLGTGRKAGTVRLRQPSLCTSVIGLVTSGAPPLHIINHVRLSQPTWPGRELSQLLSHRYLHSLDWTDSDTTYLSRTGLLLATPKSCRPQATAQATLHPTPDAATRDGVNVG